MSHSQCPLAEGKRLLKTVLLLAGLILFPVTAPGLYAQTTAYKQHMVGVKGGYAFNMVHFTPDRHQKSVPSWKNASVVYTYYHDLWGNMPYFWFANRLYVYNKPHTPKVKRIYGFRLPLNSQFHADGKTRLLLNLGCFAGYRMVPWILQKKCRKVRLWFSTAITSADYGIQEESGFFGTKPLSFI